MGNVVDMQEFERTAKTSGVFSGVEIDLLHETLLSWKSSPGDPYTVLELRDGRALVAYAIISKVNGRESTYDIRYTVIDRDYRSSSGGRRLLELIDEHILAQHSYGVIRLESSGKKLLGLGSGSFEQSGYRQIGHIAGYYGETDDYYYFVKTVYRQPPKPTAPPVGASGLELP